MKKKIKKTTAKFLKLFISIDEIPFIENGNPKVYNAMFIFGIRVTSCVYPTKI